MKTWATVGQLTWLGQQLPQWSKARCEKKAKGFLEDVVVRFFKEFPIPEAERVAYGAVSLFPQPPL